MAWRFGLGYCAYGSFLLWRMYVNEEVYDIDGFNARFSMRETKMKMRQRLPSEYDVVVPSHLRYDFPNKELRKAAGAKAILEPLVFRRRRRRSWSRRLTVRCPYLPSHAPSAPPLPLDVIVWAAVA